MHSRGVATAHGHDSPFVHSEGCQDYSVFDIVWMYVRLKKQVHHVDDSEHATFGTIIEDIRYLRNRVVVGDVVVVELTVVVNPTREDGWVSFWYNEGSRAVRTVGWSDATRVQVLLLEGLPRCEPFARAGVLAALYLFVGVFKFEAVVHII